MIGQGPIHRALKASRLFESSTITFRIEWHGFRDAPRPGVSLKCAADSCIGQNADVSKTYKHCGSGNPAKTFKTYELLVRCQCVPYFSDFFAKILCGH